MKILVVEDDFVTRKFMVSQLSKYGDVDIAVDGREAIDIYILQCEDNDRYDFICLDIMMPEISGYQVLDTIRRYEIDHELNPCIIAITSALYAEKNRQDALNRGADEFFTKPIDEDKLIDFLRKKNVLEEG